MRKRVPTLIALSSLALLAGCGKKAADQAGSAASEAVGAANAVASGAVAEASSVASGAAAAVASAVATKFDCLPAEKLSVSADASGAKLSLNGKDYTLTPVVSADGAKYSTDSGRTPGKTLVWWNKGTDGTLYEGKVGGDAASEKKLASCSVSH